MRTRGIRRLAGVLAFALTVLAGGGAARAADGIPTAITGLSSSANPSVWCQPVTLTARVTSADATAIPSGLVSFLDAGRPLGDPARVDGNSAATLTTGRLAVGAHAIGASFSDPSGRFADAGSGATLTQTIVPAATTTTLTSSQNPAVPGVPVTITALVTVNPPADAHGLEGLDGALRFTVDGAPFGPPLPLQGRYFGFQVTFAFRPVRATYAIGVSYSGDANSGPSSAVLRQVVQASSGPPAGGAPAPPTPPAAASAQPQLATMSGVLVTALRRSGLSGLTRTTEPFSAPAPGVLEQRVYSPDAPASFLRATTTQAAGTALRAGTTLRPRTRRDRIPLAAAATRRARTTLLASARQRFAAAGPGRLRLKATRAGRRAIKAGRSLKLTIVTRFTPPGGTPVTVVNRLTVKARHGAVPPRARARLADGGFSPSARPPDAPYARHRRAPPAGRRARALAASRCSHTGPVGNKCNEKRPLRLLGWTVRLRRLRLDPFRSQ